jgi:hypothetical protein
MELQPAKFLERHSDHDGPLDPEAICGWALDEGVYTLPPPISPRDQLKPNKYVGDRCSAR